MSSSTPPEPAGRIARSARPGGPEEWRLVRWWQLLGVAVGAAVLLAGGAVVGAVLEIVFEPTGATATLLDGLVLGGTVLLAVAVPAYLMLLRGRPDPAAMLGLVRPRPGPVARWLAVGAVAGAVWIVAGNLLVAALSGLLGVATGGSPFATDRAELLRALLTTGLLVPVVEELLFRGVLLNWLRARLALWPAIALSSLLFGAVHLDAIGLVYTVPAGVLFAWLYVRSNSLYVAIAAHVAANVTVVVLDYAVF
jgi:hypothetical protein